MSRVDAAPSFNLEPRRQWWGVYSVRPHMDLRALARELLLYDRLVLPVPEDLDEADRWDTHGWDTYQLDYVAKNLEDLVQLVAWNGEMRAARKDHMRMLSAAGVTSEGAAYGATPQTMVGFIWNDVLAHDPQDRLPRVPPRIVAAHLSEDEAAADFEPTPAGRAGTPPAGRTSGVLLTEPVEVPDGGDDEDAFLTAVRVAREPQFATARRALYDYEDLLVMEDRDDGDVARVLGALRDDYLDAARDHAGATVRQHVARLIAGGGGALVNSHLPGAGKPAAFAIGKVFAQFPSFVPGPNPAGAHPGEALAHVSAAYPTRM